MAIIIFPENITINLPPSIATSLSQSLLGITSLQSLLAILLSPFLAIFSYLYHTILLFIRITLFALRTELILPIVWNMDNDILEEMLMPITIGGPIFWITCAFILVSIVHSLFRAILKSLYWVLQPCISDSGRHTHEIKFCKWVLYMLCLAKRSHSQEEKHTTTKHNQTHRQPHARMIPCFQRHLPRTTLPRLVWTEAFSQPGKNDPTTPHHMDPDNADINRDTTGSEVASEDDTLTSNTKNFTTTTAATPTTSSPEGIWGDLETC